MSEVTSNAKSKISIGTTMAAANATAFATDTYTPILGVEDLGEAGSTAEILTAKVVGENSYVRKRKGSRDNGSMTLVVFYNADDEGQIALSEAEQDDLPYNFKVELNDAPAGGTPTIFYFKAIVASNRKQFSTADDFVRVTYELAIDGKFFEVPPATAGGGV